MKKLFIGEITIYFMMNGSRSGISPVVATVILVAIAIVIAIAVAFWATGLVGIFTRFEKLEITTAVYDPTNEDVELLVKNTGSSAATIDDIYVNGRPIGQQLFEAVSDGDMVHPPGGGANPCTSGTTGITCEPGQYVIISVTSPQSTGQWVHGVTYEIAVHTASGKLYPAAVLIP